MATIQEYLDTAKGAIISGASEQAISICQHVLEHFPKHLEAHCLLAEALRERGDAEGAEDLFLRVLSADPERLIARWALSILHDERGERAVAVGQLQLALEVSPDHQDLRKEVVRLSGQRTRLTRGGLARIYARAGLFDRAASEFRALLEREPARLDIKVGLAEALLRGGHYGEAEDICRATLEESPDCLKALVLLGFCNAARQVAGQPDLWACARALDPENRLARSLADELDIELPADWTEWGPVAVPLPDPADANLLPNLLAPAASAAGSGHNGSADVTVASGSSVRWAPGNGDATPPGDGAPATTAGGEDDRPLEDELAGLSQLVEESEYARYVQETEGAGGEDTMTRVEAADGEALPEPGVVAAIDDSDQTGQQPFVGVEVAPLNDSVLAERAPEPTAPEAESDKAATAEAPNLVPEWMPALGQEGPLQSDEAVDDTSWSQWADLLGEEITLDPEAEARLSAALAELQPSANADSAEAAASRPDSALSRRRDDLADGPLEDPASRLSVAESYRQAGQLDAAVAEYKTLLAAAPHLNEAVTTGLQNVLHQMPNHAQAHRVLGDAYMKVGHFQQAIDEYGRALSLEKAGG